MDNLFYQFSWLMLELEDCTLTANLGTFSGDLMTQLGERLQPALLITFRGEQHLYLSFFLFQDDPRSPPVHSVVLA